MSLLGGKRPRLASLSALVLLGLLARGFFMARALSTGGFDDPDRYLPLARSLAHGEGFVSFGRATAFRPPLYPLLLAPLVGSFGARVDYGIAALHLLLGAGTIIMAWSTARRWAFGESAALLAALVVALDPVLVAQSRSVMTETLAAFLNTAIVFALTTPGIRAAAAGGLCFGLASLCRPTALPAVLLVGLAGLVLPPGTRGERFRRTSILWLTTAAVLLPWAARNALVIGTPVFTTTHGGYTLYLANNPVYYADVVNGPPGAVWNGPRQKEWWDRTELPLRGQSEPEADRSLRAAALRTIREQPRDFAWASLARLQRFWGLAPAEAVYPRWLCRLSVLWTAPLWGLVIVGALSRSTWNWPCLVAQSLCLSYTLIHAVYWTDMRMRAPLTPILGLLAAAAIPQLGAFRRRRLRT